MAVFQQRKIADDDFAFVRRVLRREAALAAAEEPVATSNVYDIILANFKKWSNNSQGITVSQLQKLIPDPSVKGDNAAAKQMWERGLQLAIEQNHEGPEEECRAELAKLGA